MENVKFNSYPEGWEECKKLLDIPEDAKQGFMIGWANNLLRM